MNEGERGWLGARLLTALSLLSAGALLFVASRGKWSDPLVDSGREWIVPDALAAGDLLYRDVVYWFGPFTPYWHAAVFRLYESSFAALVLAGIVASAACLTALFVALRRVTGPWEALLWTGLAIPALVFMPNAGGAILGMGYRIWHAAAFTLLAVAAAVSPRADPRSGRSAAAGALAAIAGLCRTEWGVAALAAVWLAQAAAERRGERGQTRVLASGAAFLIVFGGSLGAFLWAAGPARVLHESHVLLTGLPRETRTFLLAFSQIPEWRRGVPELLYSAAMWLALLRLIELMILGRKAWPRAGKDRALLVLLLIVLVGAPLWGISGAVFFSGAPLVCLGAVWAARRARDERSPALLAFGFLGFALSFRRPLHIDDLPYVAPPLLFAFVCAAGLLRLRLEKQSPGEERRRLQAGFWLAVAALVACTFGLRFQQYLERDARPIRGTGGFLSASATLALEVEELALRIRRQTRETDGLIVFAEGELLNFLSGRRNPLRHKLYVPGYLDSSNEPQIVGELERAMPAAIVLWHRSTGEYGPEFFGFDYGKRIRAWIDQNYRVVPFRRQGAPANSTPRFSLGLREPEALPVRRAAAPTHAP